MNNQISHEQQPANPDPQEEMGLMDHLTELRKRLIIIFFSIIITSIISYSFVDSVLDLLFAPFFKYFDNGMLIGTGPAEAFLLKLKVAIFAGILLGSPIIFMQLWLFISPGLYDNEKKLVLPFVGCTSGLFILGIVFCYTCVFPFAFEFFHQQYASISKVTPAIRMDEHLGMVIKGLLGFGVVFEMPVLAYFLGRLGIIDDKMMKSASRYVIVVIFIISAVMTPPDVFSQILMAIPLLLLYAISILIVKYTHRDIKEIE